MRFTLGAWLLAGAAACGEMAADLAALGAVAEALGERYHLPANVNLNNGSHLVITFQNAPMRKLGAAEREAFAREAAAYARRAYTGAARIEDVSVGFVDATDAGPITVSHSEVPYRWPVAELGAGPGDKVGGAAPDTAGR